MSNYPGLGRERRRHGRLLKESELRYQVLADGKLPYSQPTLVGRLLDIGGGGLRCSLPEELKKRDQLVISLEFEGWCADGEDWEYTGRPDDRAELTVLARVMWCTPGIDGDFEVGVCFTGRVN